MSRNVKIMLMVLGGIAWITLIVGVHLADRSIISSRVTTFTEAKWSFSSSQPPDISKVKQYATDDYINNFTSLNVPESDADEESAPGEEEAVLDVRFESKAIIKSVRVSPSLFAATAQVTLDQVTTGDILETRSARIRYKLVRQGFFDWRINFEERELL